jgi:LacI family transcriptional regulator
MTHPSQPLNGRTPSVKDVAAAAGVSLGTVSNVMNRPEMVASVTRERVERAMTELGFIRNESARQLRAGTSRTLAYVMLDGRNPFFHDVAQGIELAAEDADLSLFICNSNGQADREEVHMDRLMQQRVQGILITPVNPDSPMLDEVSRRGIPVVIVDRVRETGGFCSVAVDDVFGGRIALEHLVEKGHTRVAFIGGPDSIGQVRERLQGAREVWAELGLPADDLVYLPTAALTVSEGRSRRSAPTICSRWGCCNRPSGRASASPRTSRSSGSTTSISRPPPRCR